ncbi:hypothetical protein BCR32DRAFT_251011 [Anaeromyces robustus]|uniref:Box C/D snoRNA protein 1 n=1 Tax=Anaeromyces robustus TaxID=1754192 RepID=A0A1Y1VTK5_9FUNG|nr:hypothetical protein BCR32DRAFT_251011 [Anaeromyces robustus]|eukprot:ORX64631.1 hypothetical protein BCR32DRAFT_251011 [Anaeromyces robustus]
MNYEESYNIEEISNSIENEDSVIEKELGEINEDIENENDENDDEEEGEEKMIMEDIQLVEPIDKSLCEMCKINKWKYTCPKCLIHTCSLPCVKAHKKELNCDGKRDKVKYISMNEYNENNLRNDYYFLEDVARANDNANREQNDFRRNKHSQKKNVILKQARKKDIILKFMPIGMKKSQINKIYYNIK